MQSADIITLIPQGAAILAPMAGVADLAFRSICKAHGCDFTFTEMISAKGLFYSGGGSRALLKLAPNECPAGVQLLGSDYGIMAEMAAWVTEALGEKAAFIDINMGCPAPKITGNGEGAALMRDLKLASSIVRSVSRATRLSVSVKFRSGWDAKSKNAVAFARAIEDSGASLLTLHPRTRDQFYSGKADWSMIKAVADAVSLPVVGKGDVLNALDYEAMLKTTGCHAVMIGRGAMGNPWIFSQIAALRGGDSIVLPTLETRLNTALEHARLATGHKGERLAMREMRKHMGWYLKGLHGASLLRAALNQVCAYDELEVLLAKSFADVLRD